MDNPVLRPYGVGRAGQTKLRRLGGAVRVLEPTWHDKQKEIGKKRVDEKGNNEVVR